LRLTFVITNLVLQHTHCLLNVGSCSRQVLGHKTNQGVLSTPFICPHPACQTLLLPKPAVLFNSNSSRICTCQKGGRGNENIQFSCQYVTTLATFSVCCHSHATSSQLCTQHIPHSLRLFSTSSSCALLLLLALWNQPNLNHSKLLSQHFAVLFRSHVLSGEVLAR